MRKNAPGQRFHNVPVSLYPAFYDEGLDVKLKKRPCGH